ncbi:MAG: hypothetical protein H6521_01615 [Mycolicibacterium sp.]|nr:hypothetical protein [Mycolicibacterium sp.]MCB9424191.1 hypothetical protein [Actinomycetota bacterium]
MAALLAIGTLPALPGARCRHRHELFDPRDEAEPRDEASYRHAAAQALCLQCPALQPCGMWFDGLPDRERPGGVVAGRIPPERRKSRQAEVA